MYASNTIEAGEAFAEIPTNLIFTPAAALSTELGRFVLEELKGGLTPAIVQTVMYLVMIQQVLLSQMLHLGLYFRDLIQDHFGVHTFVQSLMICMILCGGPKTNFL